MATSSEILAEMAEFFEGVLDLQACQGWANMLMWRDAQGMAKVTVETHRADALDSLERLELADLVRSEAYLIGGWWIRFEIDTSSTWATRYLEAVSIE